MKMLQAMGARGCSEPELREHFWGDKATGHVLVNSEVIPLSS